MSQKKNLWKKLLSQLTLVPSPAEFEITDLFALALIPFKDWPQAYQLSHWVWKGGKANGTHPVMRVGKDIMTVRRVCYCLFNEEPEARDVVFLRASCGVDDCVNPTHMDVKLYKHAAVASKQFLAKNTIPGQVEAQRDPSTTDIEALALEVESIFGMAEPATFEELMTHPVCKEFSPEDVKMALKHAEITKFDTNP